ncbi:MAG: DUF488 domain-containing protein [Alphaproteobacteria bacterium]|nr:DUF488 domain-containing protein [Alphaproteobacteria bacterium]
MKIHTIGFSGKTQNQFMELLIGADVSCVIDIRLWRAARFVPWASGTNLESALGNKYKYMPELSPTKELLNAYKNGEIDWAGYEQVFNNLMGERQIEKLLANQNLQDVCFLCSEKSPDKCHRRLVAEYLQKHFPDIQIIHL